MVRLARRRELSTDNPCHNLRAILANMKLCDDETIEEINEALSHIVEVLHNTRDSQKKHLWDLVDELLDAKIAREKK